LPLPRNDGDDGNALIPRTLEFTLARDTTRGYITATLAPSASLVDTPQLRSNFLMEIIKAT
jgi:hypothetical protein